MTLLLTDLRAIYARDLAALGREVAAYPSDAALWKPLPGTTNPGGTLALHLVGNLKHFIGAVLGGSGFVRDRDGEFARRDLTRAALAAQIAETAEVVEHTLAKLPEARLAEAFPVAVGGKTLTTSRMIVHLAVHLAYHIGQMDYHRRGTTDQAATVGTMGFDTF
jgi:uncharacterized damage-inducible protein DinB